MYPYQNLWVFCSEELPIGPLKRDTIECLLADEFGKWYGDGISLFQSSFPIRSAYYFPVKGQYTFSFRQGMRNDQLPGIQEIGLRVLPSSTNAPSEKRPNLSLIHIFGRLDYHFVVFDYGNRRLV